MKTHQKFNYILITNNIGQYLGDVWEYDFVNM